MYRDRARPPSAAPQGTPASKSAAGEGCGVNIQNIYLCIFYVSMYESAAPQKTPASESAAGEGCEVNI